MAEYLIQDSTLTAIGNAIRVKTEKTDPILVSDLANEIYGISGSGGTLVVTAPIAAEISAKKDDKIFTKIVDENGTATFSGLQTGTWIITISNGKQTASKSVDINADFTTSISFSTIPDFTYTGDYSIVNDADEEITETQGDWKIRFLTSGTLTFTTLNSAKSGIDVFCVGGGGGGGNGGGGGGYTNTARNIALTETTYEITVGAGGSGTGGASSAFGLVAAGGYPKNGDNNGCGGNGGSGGGSWNDGGAGKNGGSDGGNGSGSTSYYTGGKGQKSVAGPNGETGTTREFGESSATLYSGGGAGNGASGLGTGGSGGGGGKSGAAKANTGGGGAGGKGGSGIVIIRNKRG